MFRSSNLLICLFTFLSDFELLSSYLSLPVIQWRNREELLLRTVQEESYHKVHGKGTAKALMNYGDNPLLLAIRVRKNTIACLNCKAHK